MKAFNCGDVIPGCDGTVIAPDEDSILAWAPVHARDAHGVTDFGAELTALVRAAITTA